MCASTLLSERVAVCCLFGNVCHNFFLAFLHDNLTRLGNVSVRSGEFVLVT